MSSLVNKFRNEQKFFEALSDMYEDFTGDKLFTGEDKENEFLIFEKLYKSLAIGIRFRGLVNKSDIKHKLLEVSPKRILEV